MLGFNPLSSAPISDLGALEIITGFISTTDSNDTATINADLIASGSINTTDDNDSCIIVSGGIAAGFIDATDGTDTAQFTGTSSVSGLINTTDTDDTADINGVVLPILTGDIYAIDNDDTALLQGDVISGVDFHDAFTPDERRRAKALDKRIHKAEQKRIAAVKAQAARRRQRFIDSLYPDQKAPDSFYDPANFDEQGNFVAPKLLTKEQKVKLKKIKKQIEIEPVVDYEALIEKLRSEQNLIIESMLARMRLANLQMQLAIIEAQRQAELDDEEALLLLL
jgi:hypothetical protein